MDAAEYDVAVAEFFYRFGVLDFKLNATVPEKRLLERLKLAWDIGRRALDASLSVTLHEASEILENAGSAPLGFEHDPALYELVREHCPGVDDAKERIVLLHAAREALPAERIWPMHFEWVGFEVVQYARDGFDLAFSECAENLRLAKKLAKCETCAHWFRVYREAQVYCSQPCRHKAYRERNLG